MARDAKEYPRMAWRDFRVLTFDAVGKLIGRERGMLAYPHMRCRARQWRTACFFMPDGGERQQLCAKPYPEDLERCRHGSAMQLGLPDSEGLGGGLRYSAAFWPAFPDSVRACGCWACSFVW